MVRDALDKALWLGAVARDERLGGGALELDLDRALGNETVGLGQVGKLAEPFGEQRREVLGPDMDTDLDFLEARRIRQQIAERDRRLREQIGGRLGLQLQLGFGGMFDPAVDR